MIAAIENAMIARLKAAEESGVLGYNLRTVETYAGQFDEADDRLTEVIKNFPAVWFAWRRDEEPQRVDTHEFKLRPVFVAIVAATNYRNERAQRHGAAGEVGTYQMLKDVRALLVGRTLGLEIDAIEPGRAEMLLNSQTRALKASVIATELHTAYVAEPDWDQAEDDFQYFHADWDIPPHEGHASVPLAAGEADAEDLVELETQ